MQSYDYIIAGTGLAGLSLGYHLLQDPMLSSKRVLFVDKDAKNQNDRTWSFWERGENLFESIIHKKWDNLRFHSNTFEDITDVSPFSYKMIRGIDFYNHLMPQLQAHPSFDFLQTDIQDLSENDHQAILITAAGQFEADYIFNSAIRPKIDWNKCNYVAQHFKGWEIETPTDFFDDSVATFMDFDIEQEGEARFFYVLPTSKRKALVEIAIFSNSILNSADYDPLLRDYIHLQLGLKNFDVTHEEVGVIPMTDYNFEQHQGKRILNIGTSGGQVKASSGYAFTRVQVSVAKIYRNLQINQPPLRGLNTRNRFSLYDKLFLNVVLKNRLSAPELFTYLFKNNPTQLMLRFLSEETSIPEEIKVMWSVPSMPFLKAIGEEYF